MTLGGAGDFLVRCTPEPSSNLTRRRTPTASRPSRTVRPPAGAATDEQPLTLPATDFAEVFPAMSMARMRRWVSSGSSFRLPPHKPVPTRTARRSPAG